MAALGATAFAALAWGSIVLVGLVFAYLLVVVLREARDRGDGNRGAR